VFGKHAGVNQHTGKSNQFTKVGVR